MATIYSRLTFEVRRKDTFPEAPLLALLMKPALEHGLRGVIDIRGQSRYTAVMEGSREAVAGYLIYVGDYLPAAVGDINAHATHHHQSLAFGAGVRVVFPE